MQSFFRFKMIWRVQLFIRFEFEVYNISQILDKFHKIKRYIKKEIKKIK